MKVVVRIGRWSEGSCVRVVHCAELVIVVGRIVRSGEVGCCLCWWVGGGILVGLSLFIIVWSESLMILFIVMPR